VEATSATKDHVIGGIHRLVLAAVIAVQGVAHLVGQGEHAVQIVLVVQEHIGVGPGRAGGIGAAALAGVFINVDPAVVKALAQKRRVVLAQHAQGLQHGLLGLLKGDLPGGVGHDGHIDVGHVQLVRAQQLFAQGDIAVHLVQVGVHGVDEVFVHRAGTSWPYREASSVLGKRRASAKKRSCLNWASSVAATVFLNSPSRS
jgi:hypothetical protein